MLSETLKPTGELKIVVTDKNGKVKEERTEKNLVVTTGLVYIHFLEVFCVSIL